MFRIFRITHLIIAVGLIFTLAFTAFADTLRLKDGSIIKGRIVAFGGGKFTVIVGEGTRQRQLTFNADEVESIQFDSAQPGSSVLTSSRQTEQPAKKEPASAENSSPSKNVPRVIMTDSTVGSSNKPSTPAKPAPAKQLPQVMETTKPPVGTKPIEVAVKVLADNTSNGWTNSGWVVKKGQKIRVIGGGTISLGRGKRTGPSGLYDLEDPEKLLKSVPTGALIAVIGDDNNEFIYVGSERTFTASRDGALFLGVNEGNLDDNSGSFDVRIEIQPI